MLGLPGLIYCCKKLDGAIEDGKIRHDGKQWHTVSSSVYMLVCLKYCAWCGKPLPFEPVVPEHPVPLFEKEKKP